MQARQDFGVILLIMFSFIIYGSCRRLGMDSDLIEPEQDMTNDETTHIPSDFGFVSMRHQSPIDLRSSSVTFIDQPPLKFKGHWKLHAKSLIGNTGHTIEIGETLKNVHHPIIEGGPLLHSTYIFAQAHFHWGNQSVVGSEHSINGQRYSMEVHFVHHSSQYRSVKEARGHIGGLAVVAFFLKVAPTAKNKPNKQFNVVVHHLKGIRFNLASEHAEPSILSCLQKLATPRDYFFYYGSLTTEPFSENVQWIVYPKWASITENQVEQFRHLLDSNKVPLTSNWRPLQPLNDRIVNFITSENDYYF